VFLGQNFHDTLAAVIENSPDWSALPAGVPLRVAELLRRCLQNDPHRRLRDAGDARLGLEDSLAGLGGDLSPASGLGFSRSAVKSPPPASRSAGTWRSWPALAAVAVALAAFALGKWSLPPVTSHPLPPEAPAPAAWSGQYLLQVEPATYGP